MQQFKSIEISIMSLSCKLNKENFKAGDFIKLKAGLTVENDKKGKELAGSTLRVVIKGEEFACVYWTDKTAEDHFERKAHPLFRVDDVLIKIPNEGLKEGFYEYPFEHQLSHSLPSSFYFKKGKEHCSVRYSFMLILETSGFLSQDQILEFPFAVKARPKMVAANQKIKILQPDIQEITLCCCINKGSMSLGCALDKTDLTQHDALTIVFVTENNSSVPLTEVKLSLFERVEFEARHKKAKINNLICQKIFKPEEIIGSSKVTNIRKSLVPGEIDKNLFDLLKVKDAHPKKNFSTFLIRPDVSPSYVGKSIRVRHQIELVLMTGEMFTNPEATASIKILPSADCIEDEKDSGEPSVENPISQKSVVFPGKLSKSKFAMSQRTLSIDDDPPDRPDLFRAPSQASVRFFSSQKSSGLLEEENMQKQYPISYEGILEAMDDTYIDRTLLEEYLENASLGYKPILQSLSSKQYGTIVGEVNYVTDQSTVAGMLAKGLEEKFTCEYVASACRLAESANRADIVKETAEYVVDIHKNHSLIEACLSPFDKLMVKDVLEEYSK